MVWSCTARMGRAAVLAVVVAATGVTGGCGHDESTSGPALSAEARAGREVAMTNGCVACHGPEGEGTIGPSWQGLYGSVVLLDDGSTVVADEDYLRRAIVDPAAERVAGYNLAMPKVALTDEQVDALITYIQELS